MLTKAAQDLIALQRGGSYSLSRDALKHRVYDSRFFAATISDFTFFTQPVGAAWRAGTKALSETNMYDTGKLPQGQVFLIARMGIACIGFDSVVAATVEQSVQAFNNVLNSSVFEIKIQGREFDYQIPGVQFRPMPVNVAGVATAASIHVGETFANGWSKLDPTPIVIDNQVSFQVIHRLNNPDPAIVAILNASTAILNGINATMMVILEGLLTRSK